MTIAEGIFHDVPEHIYHGDPAPSPSLSHGIAKVLLYKSPRHAWHAHPRLNTMQEEDNDATTAKEEGSALHRLLLGTGHEIVEVDADNWRGKNGDVRREARARGAVPILTWRLAELERCVEAAKDQLASHHDARNALTSGRPEATVSLARARRLVPRAAGLVAGRRKGCRVGPEDDWKVGRARRLGTDA